MGAERKPRKEDHKSETSRNFRIQRQMTLVSQYSCAQITPCLPLSTHLIATCIVEAFVVQQCRQTVYTSPGSSWQEQTTRVLFRAKTLTEAHLVQGLTSSHCRLVENRLSGKKSGMSHWLFLKLSLTDVLYCKTPDGGLGQQLVKLAMEKVCYCLYFRVNPVDSQVTAQKASVILGLGA